MTIEERLAAIAESERLLEAFVTDIDRVAADPPPGKRMPSEIFDAAGLTNYGRYDCPYCHAPIAHFIGCPSHDFRTFYANNQQFMSPWADHIPMWTTPEERLAALHTLVERIPRLIPCPHCGGSKSHASGCVKAAILAHMPYRDWPLTQWPLMV